jgi:hypothetical protein
VIDPDCANATVGVCDWCADTGSCNTAACPGTINPTNNAVCSSVVVPPGWTCAPAYFADGLCDCGCGAFDSNDCANMTVGACDYCDDTGSCNTALCPGTINTTNNAVCSSGVPPGWTCNPAYFGDGDCDCGCGAFDSSDCANMTVGACDYCDDPGSCNTAVCPGTINTTNNAVCI